MSDDTPADLLHGLDGRPGATRFLRYLGLHPPFRNLTADFSAAVPVRAISQSRNGVLTAFVIEMRGTFEADTIQTLFRALRSLDGVRDHIAVIAERDWVRVALAIDSPAAGTRSCTFDRTSIRAADVEVIAELGPEPGETGTALAQRIRRALGRSAVSARFFRDVVAMRNLIARHWSGVPATATADRDALALLLLSRLMFLYFLQRRGLLAGDVAFLPGLLRDWARTRSRASFYRARIRTLFFGVLNRRPEQRTARARSLGALPYLNGGLFELHRIEDAYPHLDLPDDVLRRVFSELLEKYRFTTRTPGEAYDHGGVSLDPEILGRIFEGLMPGDRRATTGTYYTPSELVDRVVAMAMTEHLSTRCDIPGSQVEALLAGTQAEPDTAVAERLQRTIREIRVVDPACGSGAFLLGAFKRLVQLRLQTEPGSTAGEVRRDVVARALHGVDLLEDAALICSLRLWLALVPDCDDGSRVTPLPNLDRRIRQGDSLIDPLDIGDETAGRPRENTTPPALRTFIGQLQPASMDYLAAGPESRPRIRRRLEQLEHDLAAAWLDALEGRLRWEERELSARAADRDLFDQSTRESALAARRLRTIRSRLHELLGFRSELRGRRRLPFFSYRVHFAEARDGFDLVLSNPPWVRSQHWPPTARRMLRRRYRVCEEAGWPFAARLVSQPAAAGAQVDLSLLFLERCIGLLADGGTLAVLMPAKLFRSLSAGGARALLARSVRIVCIEDHSLDHRALFDADAFTAVLLGRRSSCDPPAAANNSVNVTLSRAGCGPLTFEIPERDLSLRPDDARAPWLLAPPACRAVLRHMQSVGSPIGEQHTIRRGVMTGANAVMVVRDVESRLGDLARIRTEGYYRATTAHVRRTFCGWIESTAIRPTLRGTDVGRWRASPTRHLLWTPFNDDRSSEAPPKLQRFLLRHRGALSQERRELGSLHRLSSLTLGHKVVWSDLASDLRAAAVPSRVRCLTGFDVPLIPLNTVYFVAASSARDALLLAAYLNSLPLRVFARAIAERAKDGHFRFFAWTVAVLPLPGGWRDNELAAPLLDLSTSAHRDGAMNDADAAELDRLVSQSFGLDAGACALLAGFDAWLSGKPTEGAAHHESAA